MADDAEVAARFTLDPVVARECLLDFQAVGWVTRVEFVGTTGWTLTTAGRMENERQLARELAATDSAPDVRKAYTAFLPHNDRLLRACTDWQLRPRGADPLAANDHTDKEWDQRVLSELAPLSEVLQSLCGQLGARFARFRGYDDRFFAALNRAQQGEHSWVTRPIDEYRLIVFPVLVGDGKRLFSEVAAASGLTLVRSSVIGAGSGVLRVHAGAVLRRERGSLDGHEVETI